jgi:hypothetical protein
LAASRARSPGLPGLTEPEAVRHFVRLSQKNYAIDLGLFPLGSCTMKHNPRLNEKVARLPGFADVHPMQPQSTVQGALELIEELADWLMKLTNMPAVAISPKAGAHGELVRHAGDPAALIARGEGAAQARAGAGIRARHQPGHGGPCGFTVDEIPPPPMAASTWPLKAKLSISSDVAGIMLTNPNTCGLFERDIRRSPTLIHAPAATSIATARTSTPSSAGCARAISASMRCTSTCTRPSRRRTAAAVRARARPCSPPRSRLTRRCRSSRRRSRRPALRRAPCEGAEFVRPHVRLPRPDGHVHARARLHAQPRR